MVIFRRPVRFGEQKRLGNADLSEGENVDMQMKLEEEPLKCETKSRAIRSSSV